MRGASIAFAQQIREQSPDEQWDALLVTDMMNLAEFLALTRPRFDRVPVVLYMHENQISYPLQEGETLDYHYAITNMISMMAADKIVFNSKYNQQDFFQGIQRMMKKMPDHQPTAEQFSLLQAKSCVIEPGCDFTGFDQPRYDDQGPPVILWNHRWEHDKQPEIFFDALRKLKRKHIPFRLIVCGESYRDSPDCFEQAHTEFESHLLHWGYAESRQAYANLLAQSDIVVSSSMQEFFGISIAEAMYAGAFPLLPHRLNYPNLVPEEFHKDALFQNDSLTPLLIKTLKRVREKTLPDPRPWVEPYAWESCIHRYDALFT